MKLIPALLVLSETEMIWVAGLAFAHVALAILSTSYSHKRATWKRGVPFAGVIAWVLPFHKSARGISPWAGVE
jgi:hypothetical protein